MAATAHITSHFPNPGPVTHALRAMHREPEPIRRDPLQRALRWVVLMLFGPAA